MNLNSYEERKNTNASMEMRILYDGRFLHEA